MPKLVLQFDGKVLKNCGVEPMASIGRLPDNTVVIDNPGVSGHHACVFRDGDRFIVEDLASTNGTFVNDKRVRRQAIQGGDVIRVGRHTLVFDQTAATRPDPENCAARITSNPTDTVFLEGEKYKSLLGILKETEDDVADVNGAMAAADVGVLKVLAGRTDQPEYRLEARTSVVGKSDRALVRLQGWFKPNEAVAIARNGDGYVATLLGGTTRINNQRLSGRHTLKPGDILEVSGLTLEFRYS